MTREEAIRWRWERAGSTSIDERLVMRCAERGGGCSVWAYDEKLQADRGDIEMRHAAGRCLPCSKHQPSKRFAWLLFVNPDDIVRHSLGNDAFAIDELRKYLPRTHLEYRP